MLFSTGSRTSREIMELTWILTSMTAKGLLNRAHSYKAVVQENEESDSSDPDKGVMMALYNYPILMAADILMFKADKVPVGRDQKQHMEMTRDIAQRFNHHYGDILVIPEAEISEHTAVLSGLDGRKMSKSYNNIIPLFAEGEETPQADHEDQDQQPGARRAQGNGRLKRCTRSTRPSRPSRKQWTSKSVTPKALPGAK